ncbi:phosphatase inhibitor-domain-containing protein [Cunninghamella echinulata]|nr:phosphatase inhibitor-domain-containing protein [Cunninghamella echinulata]
MYNQSIRPGYNSTSTRIQERLNSPSHSSRTLVIEESALEQNDNSTEPEDNSVGVLRLHGDMTARRPPVVRWDDDVVDNEHMGKKKSKICCIYHKPREVGESSDSESSSNSSDSDSDSDDHSNGRCRHQHGKKKKKNPRSVSPNAYERQPVYNKNPSQPSKDNNINKSTSV